MKRWSGRNSESLERSSIDGIISRTDQTDEPMEKGSLSHVTSTGATPSKDVLFLSFFLYKCNQLPTL